MLGKYYQNGRSWMLCFIWIHFLVHFFKIYHRSLVERTGWHVSLVETKKKRLTILYHQRCGWYKSFGGSHIYLDRRHMFKRGQTTPGQTEALKLIAMKEKWHMCVCVFFWIGAASVINCPHQKKLSSSTFLKINMAFQFAQTQRQPATLYLGIIKTSKNLR